MSRRAEDCITDHIKTYLNYLPETNCTIRKLLLLKYIINVRDIPCTSSGQGHSNHLHSFKRAGRLTWALGNLYDFYHILFFFTILYRYSIWLQAISISILYNFSFESFTIVRKWYPFHIRADFRASLQSLSLYKMVPFLHTDITWILEPVIPGIGINHHRIYLHNLCKMKFIAGNSPQLGVWDSLIPLEGCSPQL